METKVCAVAQQMQQRGPAGPSLSEVLGSPADSRGDAHQAARRQHIRHLGRQRARALCAGRRASPSTRCAHVKLGAMLAAFEDTGVGSMAYQWRQQGSFRFVWRFRGVHPRAKSRRAEIHLSGLRPSRRSWCQAASPLRVSAVSVCLFAVCSPHEDEVGAGNQITGRL